MKKAQCTGFDRHGVSLARIFVACIVLNQDSDVFGAFGEINIESHKREPDRLFGRVLEFHGGFFRGPSPFFQVTGAASRHNVLPGFCPALHDRVYVIQGELADRGFLAAVLTGVMVSQKDVIAVEPHHVFESLQGNILDESDDPRNGDGDRD